MHAIIPVVSSLESEVGKLDHASEGHLRVLVGFFFPTFMRRDVNIITGVDSITTITPL